MVLLRLRVFSYWIQMRRRQMRTKVISLLAFQIQHQMVR
nr:MAG TPA: hypothetical protein [Bacteriophage sp.]